MKRYLKLLLKFLLRPLIRRLTSLGSLNPRDHQPPLPLPPGQTRAGVLKSLETLSIDGADGGQELKDYVGADLERFLHTLSLVPQGSQRILEIGSHPYFTTLLMKWYRPDAELEMTNYWSEEPAVRTQSVRATAPEGHATAFELTSRKVNVESQALPWPDAAFDVVLFCEVIEHLTMDPLRALLELKRVLKPNGKLIVTTPNAVRLENVARFVGGANIYDPYSGYGPYGRHNREYTSAELKRIMTYCGFAPDTFYTADVHENATAHYCAPDDLQPLLAPRVEDLGQYLISRWTNSGPAGQRKPAWLYRSYPEGELDPTPF